MHYATFADSKEMSQASLFSVACNRTRPPPQTAAADFIGIDDVSTDRWLCKGQRHHPYLPATEWICSKLAAACGLPVPPVAIVEVAGYPDQAFFGSLWQGGALECLEIMGRVSNPHIFGNTFAADLFVHNIDRHLANFLYLDLAGEIVARVIDFSHALCTTHWPLLDLPLDANCNTMRARPFIMKKIAAGDPGDPRAVLARISELADDWIVERLNEMPTAWLPDQLALSLVCWWIGAARHERVRAALSCL